MVKSFSNVFAMMSYDCQLKLHPISAILIIHLCTKQVGGCNHRVVAYKVERQWLWEVYFDVEDKCLRQSKRELPYNHNGEESFIVVVHL